MAFLKVSRKVCEKELSAVLKDKWLWRVIPALIAAILMSVTALCLDMIITMHGTWLSNQLWGFGLSVVMGFFAIAIYHHFFAIERHQVLRSENAVVKPGEEKRASKTSPSTDHIPVGTRWYYSLLTVQVFSLAAACSFLPLNYTQLVSYFVPAAVSLMFAFVLTYAFHCFAMANFIQDNGGVQGLRHLKGPKVHVTKALNPDGADSLTPHSAPGSTPRAGRASMDDGSEEPGINATMTQI